MSACLDSWAVIEWLEGREPSAERVSGLRGRPVMSWINAVEVYYRVERDQGRVVAERVHGRLRALLDLDLPDQLRMIEVARLKAVHAIALGDCFAIATAAAHGLPLLTGDPEIIGEAGLPCMVEDLRPRRPRG